MNICILLIDCLRPDHLGCYGYHRNTSPSIDSIAKKGIIFGNAFAQSNWTYPSIYSMMTGRYPSTLALTWFNQRVNKEFDVLPEFLSRRNFHTAIFSPFKVLLNPEGFCSHFNEVRDVRLNDATPRLFKDWISSHKDTFLLFHIAEYVHEPFCADEKNVDLFLEERKLREKALKSDVVKALTSKSSTGTGIRKTAGKVNKHLASLSGSDLKFLLTCYDAGIYQVDKAVGKIHEVLQSQNDDYLLILIADHGESFMEHGVFGHGLTLYDEVIRVPLIVDYRNCKHTRISATVQLMDIFPSILDFLQFGYDFKIDGISFAPALAGSEISGRTSFSEGFPNIALIKDNHKLLTSYSKFWDYKEVASRFSGKKTSSRLRDILSIIQRYWPAKLYDLEEDRRERVNLRWRKRDVYDDLNARLTKVMSEIQNETLQPEDKELEEEVRKQLELLGYL